MRRAFEILENESECTDINHKNFESKIIALENEDYEKVKFSKVIAGASLVVSVIAAGAASLYASFKAFKNSESVHENHGEAIHENDVVEIIRKSDDENDNAHGNSGVNKNAY